ACRLARFRDQNPKRLAVVRPVQRHWPAEQPRRQASRRRRRAEPSLAALGRAEYRPAVARRPDRRPDRAGAGAQEGGQTMITKRSFLRSFLVLSCLVSVGSPAHAGHKPPNVLIILSDDQGWGDLSIHGNKNLKTPNLDSLAKRGARFDRFYVQPVCAP